MSVPENGLDFKGLEEFIYDWACQQGAAVLKSVFEQYDLELQESRDKSVYRYKEKRQKTLKTVMGEVEYSRVMYEVRQEDGTIEYVYLLDEALGLRCVGQLSGVLSEVIAQAACEGSYRSAARQVSEMTGQRISHACAWDVVQALGERVGEEEERAATAASVNQGAGKHVSKAPFEEQDGIMLALQGKSRKDHGPRKEMKIAIAYDGAEKKGKKRYELTNKVAYASFEGAEKFVKLKEGVIAGHYDVDEIEIRLLGGDGASWIRRSQTDDTVHFQVDRYHINQNLLRNAPDPEARGLIRGLLHSKEIDLMLHVIETEALSAVDAESREKYEKLLGYFGSNRDGLVPIHRRGLELPEPPEGVEYRRLGTMESNVFTIIGNRMKGRRACWSIEGGNNMARLLSLKHTGRLSEALKGVGALALPERYSEEIPVTLSAAKAPKSEGKGYEGFQRATIPPSMKWLKEIVAMRSLSEVSF